MNRLIKISNFWAILSVLLLIVFVPTRSIAQQDPVYTQYLNNMLTIQPAYAGISGYLNVTALSRAQWVGFEGAPNTNTLTANLPLKSYNVGLGISLINDKWGPIRQNAIYIDYAYRIRTSERNYLSFGIKGGFNIYQARLTDLEINDPLDPIFATDVNFRFMPNFGLGIMWHGDRFFIGASTPKVFKNNVTDATSGHIYREVNHYYAMGGYVFFLSDAVKFKPALLYRWTERTPSYTDFSANFLFYDRVWAGATYRFRNSYALLFQFRLSDQLNFGYSYDLTTFHQGMVNSGTHEFMISYDFTNTTRRGRSVTPRYF